MKKLFAISILFVSFIFVANAQSGISLKLSPKDGSVFTKESNLFVTTFSTVGINTDAEFNSFKSKLTANSVVNSFEALPKVNNEYKATIKLTTKDKNLIVPVLQSANVTSLIVKNKTYTLDQYDQIGKDLKPKVSEKPKTVSGN